VRGELAAPAGPTSPAASAGRAALDVAATWGDSGQPAPGIPVAVQELEHPHPDLAWRFATTDLTGRARIEGLRGGEVRVVAHGVLETSSDVRVERENAAAISLPRGVAIRGRVSDSDGRAANNAEIYLAPESAGPPFDNAFPVGSADSMAHFAIPDIPDGAQLLARSHERAPSRASAVADAIDGEVRMSVGVRGAILLAQLLDAAEAVVVDAPVLVVSEPDGSRVLLRTDDEGRIALRGVAPGAASALVHADGFAPLRADFVLRADARNEHILRLAPGASVLGTVRDASGKAVEGARVSWIEADAEPEARLVASSFARSLRDGSFRLADLPGGSMTIRVECPGFEATDATVAVAAGGTARLDFEVMGGR
jgi:hypothetical protein